MKLQNHLGHCWKRISKCRCDERDGSLYVFEEKNIFIITFYSRKIGNLVVFICCWGSITVKFVLLLMAVAWYTLYWKSVGMDLH